MTRIAITGGTLVDGSGAAARPGTVLVDGNRLRLLDAGQPPPAADRVIDATGLVVAPGFIDLHSHSGLQLLADPRHEPKVRQGVTTEVIGVDGLSYAPLAPDDLRQLVEMNAGLDGRPELTYDWTSVASYLERLDRAASVNLAMLVGNTALRIGAIGWEDQRADERSMANMRAQLREAMEEGAFGLSSGLDYPPGSYASTAELAALANEAGRHGGFYHTHVRYPLGDRYLDPFREALEIGRRGEAAVHLTHFYHRPTYPAGPEPMLALVEDARANGINVTFDMYPYEWASTRLLIQLPQWVQSGGPMRLKERLAERSTRDRLRREMGPAYTSSAGWADVRLGAFVTDANATFEGRTLADVMHERGVDAVDAICDLLLAEDLRVNQVTSGPSTETLPRFAAHPLGMFGTDSTFIGARPSPRTYGSFPRVLGEFVRERRIMSLEEAVRKMTSAPAALLGLTDRGLLRDGMAADIVIFDAERVRSLATYDEPRRFPEGIEHVLVNGEPVVDAGGHSGALPGRALRRGRPAPSR
ncbi:MAG TPA: amidohydrolase family protein [Candidatus Limnocylindria bacterium]|nr:amidohydrolase family protein [Candidatus Limnocylindria bacterium]